MNRRNFLKFSAALPTLALFPFAALAGYEAGDLLTDASLNALARECGLPPKFKNGDALGRDDLNELARASGGTPGFVSGRLVAADINRMLPRLYGAANRER